MTTQRSKKTSGSGKMVHGRTINTIGRIIIIDRLISDGLKDALRSLPDLMLLDLGKLANNLLEMLSPELSSTTEALIVFPGNGGQIVQALIGKQLTGIEQLHVHAKRVWTPGSNPIVEVGNIKDPRFLLLTEKVIVIDDVISSGKTLKMLYERNSWRTPRAKWVAATCLSQNPRGNFPFGLYDKIYSAATAINPNGRLVPMNSLSTLVDDQAILKSYATRSGYGDKLIDIVTAIT